MRWRRSRRGQKSEIRSLMERLNDLECTNFVGSPVTAEPVVSTVVGIDRPWGVIVWFGIGFACACIAGGIALFAAVTETRAKEAEPGAGPALSLTSRPQSFAESRFRAFQQLPAVTGSYI